MRGINQAKRKCVYHEGGLSHLLFRKSMINKLLFRVQHVLEKIAEKGGLFPSFCAASSCVVLGDRSIHHPFSFSNSFFHCSEIGPRKDGLFGSSKMHCTQVSVVDDRLIVLPINRPIPIIGFSQSIGRYFQTKTWIFKKKKIGETVKKLNKKIDKVFFFQKETH